MFVTMQDVVNTNLISINMSSLVLWFNTDVVKIVKFESNRFVTCPANFSFLVFRVFVKEIKTIVRISKLKHLL